MKSRAHSQTNHVLLLVHELSKREPSRADIIADNLHRQLFETADQHIMTSTSRRSCNEDSTMRATSSITSLLLLTRQGASFIAKGHYSHSLGGGGRHEGAAPRRITYCATTSSRRATLLDETDRLLLERMDSDQVNYSKGVVWALLPVLFSINVVLIAAFLLTEGSPPVETSPSLQCGGSREIERIEHSPTYNAEEDVTMWMDSSAGFFFY